MLLANWVHAQRVSVRVGVCVWGLGCSPLAPLAEFLGSLKHSVLVFAQRAEFHLNSARCFQNQINLHWKPSTGVDYVGRGRDRDRDREEGTPSTRADTRWPQPGEKLAPMIDSLNENLMENSFASHKLVWFGSVRFQFLWGRLGDPLSSCSTSWSSPLGFSSL